MSIIKEFREFAMRGNVVDLAVGVIIGAAFGKIVSSLVADIIMPPLGLLIGGIDFKQFAVTLRDAQGDIPAVVMHYGVFIQNVFDFLIVAFAIFMAIKLINKLNRKKKNQQPRLHQLKKKYYWQKFVICWKSRITALNKRLKAEGQW